MYQAYPDMDIDIEYEQNLLEKHDVIIFQHPFFWYSTPSILKEWQDMVLQHSWAYGSIGNALKDKLFLVVTSTGGSREAYSPSGHNRFTIKQLLAPIEQMVTLCKMTFLPPYVIHGTHSITQEEIMNHKDTYFTILELLNQEKIKAEDLSGLDYFNDIFNQSGTKR